MLRKPLVLLAGAVVLSAAVGATALGAGKASPKPLRTAIFDPPAYTAADAPAAFARTKDAGASVVRLLVDWHGAAHTQPANPTDPADPAYRWTQVDTEVKQASAAGLSVILDVLNAPSWAMTGTPAVPDTTMLGQFATALAKHYGGSVAGIPRVKYFMVWNEPNLPEYFAPVTVAVDWYRDAVNAFTAAVHAVHPDNLTIAGGLGPFGHGDSGPDRAPMKFISDLLCVTYTGTPKPTCKTKVSFDVWAFHPYTEGGPTHKARFADDLSLGDIPRAEAVLEAAQKAGHLVSHGALQYWVTEFSWDTNPPDKKGVPIALQARWTSEVLYRLWSDDVTLVTWFLLADQPYPSEEFQSGLYFNGPTLAAQKPKPTLTAFRFPFVAIQGKGEYTLWGRTPGGHGGKVTIELKSGKKWTKVTTLRAASNGIFQGTWKTALKSGDVRAHLGKDTSLPFGMKPVPDRAVTPFGD